ncbi:MAG TPA: glucose-6-phosphate dehydrogenase assembly protein OpcA [Bryobacteraceae bacterium]|nr:glucose-6-phosphate dehydrogenase assembly protein OpcA [Bryobacteraceae bacterium]
MAGPPNTGVNVVQPEKILKDLGKLWVDLGKQDENGVLRACAMTFIVVAEEKQDAALIGETIAALMHEHPSRAIVIRVRENGGGFLEARVLAQCWMPFGGRQQICCEQIEITASSSSFADVPTVIRGLTVPDLPVVLYCPSARLCRTQGFQSLLPLATKLIIDSGTLPVESRLLEYLAELPKHGVRKSDLAWARLTPWRDAIAQIFEDPANLRRIYEIQEISILYAYTDDPIPVYYLAGWFMHVLGASVHLKVARGVGPAYASIAKVAFMGLRFEASVELVSPTSVEMKVNSVEQHVVFPETTDYEVLREELAIVGRDPVYEDVLGLANLLARPSDGIDVSKGSS